jgi:hypothetical protein
VHESARLDLSGNGTYSCSRLVRFQKNPAGIDEMLLLSRLLIGKETSKQSEQALARRLKFGDSQGHQVSEVCNGLWNRLQTIVAGTPVNEVKKKKTIRESSSSLR